MKNIILCGFMGCGKTTVGKALEQRTGMKNIDLDAYIEQKAGMTVSEIFAAHGEDGFRAMERDACAELSAAGGYILSLGGGTVLFEQNCAALKQNGVIFLLDISLDEAKRRLKDVTDRPLLMRPDRDEAVTALYTARRPAYQNAADVIIDGEQTPDKVAADIDNAFKARC